MDGRCTPHSDWLSWLEYAQGGKGPSGRGPSVLDNIVGQVLDRAFLVPGDSVLDLGAGTGAVTLGATRRVGRSGSVVAVDNDPDCLSELSRRAAGRAVENLTTVLAGLEELPFTPGSFDAVLCRSALVYSDDPDAAAAEMSRVLRRGGRFSFFEPLPGESSWEGLEEIAGGAVSEMERALKESGGARAFDRSALRRALRRQPFDLSSLVVAYNISMKDRPVDEIVNEYLFDLPSGLSAFDVLKKAGCAEDRIVGVAMELALGATAGLVVGRLPCIFAWGVKTP